MSSRVTPANVTWLNLHLSCIRSWCFSDLTFSTPRDESYGFRYWISLDDPSRQASVDDFPKIWFEARSEDSDQDTIVPYLVPPLEPLPGMYTVTKLQYAERQFITSSGIKDAIFGFKPVRNSPVLSSN